MYSSKKQNLELGKKQKYRFLVIKKPKYTGGCLFFEKMLENFRA
ncbi:MAG: hypothetical protein RL757_3116 [Bacteroidota bacterium]|jgi:hypothetical protein